MPRVKARKGDLVAFRVPGIVSTPVGGRATKLPANIWKLGLVHRTDRAGEIKAVIEFGSSAPLKTTDQKGGTVQERLVVQRTVPNVEAIAVAYRDRFTRENFASQGNFASADDVREWLHPLLGRS